MSGEGTYVYMGKIFASVTGRAKMLAAKSWQNQGEFDKITVESLASKNEKVEEV